jgi:glycosyltransferase involved in cell wall biosynthesis
VQHLAREKFDAVVIHGHSPAAMLVGAAAAKASGAAIFMRCDAHLGSACSPFKAILRRPLLGTLYSTFDGTLAIGTANAAFYRNMGVPQARIHSMPFTVDNERFTLQAGISTAERAAVRASLGVNDDRPIVLYAAKFQLLKRPADLLYAAARLNGEVPPFRLVMAGSGELDGHLRSLVQSLSLENVHFAGFINQAALPKLYAASDIFVLPSENEAWGLAVNEAMCAGLPIVVSNEVGCVSDLVHEGVNGHLHKAGNIEALAGALRPLLSSRPERERMSLASQEIISHWSYAECLHGLRQALASIGNHHEPAAAVAR